MQKKNIKITKQFKEKKLSTVLNSKLLNKKLIETNSDEDEFSKIKSRMVKCKKANEAQLDNCLSKSTFASSKSKRTVVEDTLTSRNSQTLLFPNSKSNQKCCLSSKTKTVLDAILFKAREKKEKNKEKNKENVKDDYIKNEGINGEKINEVGNINGNQKQNNNTNVHPEMQLSEKTMMILESSIVKKQKNGKVKESFADLKIKKEPKLSLKTLKIIDRLNRTRKNRFDNEDDEETISSFRTESSFTNLRLKYSDLLNMELRLPTKYKVLIEKFKMLESAININKINDKNGNNYLSAIKKSIESSTFKSFDLKVFQQILYVVPHFYIYKYKKGREEDQTILQEMFGQKNYDLMIDIPNDYNERIQKEYPNDFNFLSINFVKENEFFNASPVSPSPSETAERLKVFKGILTKITNEFHKKFCEKEQIHLKFDPLKKKTWHHKFDVDKECEDIPLFEIPSAPKSVNVFQKEIEEDIKSEVLEGALEMVKEEEAKREINKNKNDGNNESNLNSNSNSKQSKQIMLNKFMSAEMLQKLRAKELANSVNNEINDYNRSIHGKKDKTRLYQEIIKQIKTICIMNNKSMKLSEIADMIGNNSKQIKNAINNSEDVAEIIIKINEKYPGYYKIIDHSSLGKIVVLEGRNKSLPKDINLDE